MFNQRKNTNKHSSNIQIKFIKNNIQLLHSSQKNQNQEEEKND